MSHVAARPEHYAICYLAPAWMESTVYTQITVWPTERRAHGNDAARRKQDQLALWLAGAAFSDASSAGQASFLCSPNGYYFGVIGVMTRQFCRGKKHTLLWRLLLSFWLLIGVVR